MKRDQQILSEITTLKERISNLNKLLELRTVANRLEAEVMHGTGSKHAVAVITEVICRRFNLDLTRLTSPGREQSVVLPRQIAFYLIRSMTGTPFERIGEYFGRDHGTIMHACHSVNDRMQTQPEFMERVKDLMKECVDLLAKENGAVNNLWAGLSCPRNKSR